MRNNTSSLRVLGVGVFRSSDHSDEMPHSYAHSSTEGDEGKRRVCGQVSGLNLILLGS